MPFDGKCSRASPDKATYAEGDRVLVRFEPGSFSPGDAPVRIVVRKLGRVVLEAYARSDAAGGAEADLGSFGPGGYEAAAYGPDGAVAAATAFDVHRPGGRPFRYGFLSDFSPRGESGREERAAAALRHLAAFHATHVQFYDWMYRHHELLPPAARFRDAMGREVDLDEVRARIAACVGRGMVPVAYGAVYGAEADYAAGHPDQILERSDGAKRDFISLISICDVSPGSPWCARLVEEYREACRELGFGGVHMDQYGSPKWAVRADGSLVDLGDCFGPLVDEAKAALGEDRFVVFNCVNAWPLDFLGGSRQDAVYVEVWEPYGRYRHLAELARKARLLAPGKPVVLAAYLKCFLDPNETDARRESCARLSFAVICANGATQLLFGEGDGVLAEGYYVNHGRWRPRFEPTLRAYADFVVKYGDLLFGPAVRDESLAYAGGVNDELRLEGLPWSVEYEAGKAGVSVARVGADSIAVNLVNLIGAEEESWTCGKEDPLPRGPFRIEIEAWGDVAEAFWASPDDGLGQAEPLAWEYAPHPRGRAVRIEVPSLAWWTLVYVRFSPPRRVP